MIHPCGIVLYYSCQRAIKLNSVFLLDAICDIKGRRSTQICEGLCGFSQEVRNSV